MSRHSIFLPKDASKARLRDAWHARANRAEIVRALSHGQVSRRELFKWGLFTGAGLLAPIRGLNPMLGMAKADGGGGAIPTGAPPSPMFGVQAFTTPMPRFDCINETSGDERLASLASLNPTPTASANQTLQKVDPALGGGMGPVEGRPRYSADTTKDIWAHQKFSDPRFSPRVAVEVSQMGARDNPTYDP
jgi:manganese oxidase